MRILLKEHETKRRIYKTRSGIIFVELGITCNIATILCAAKSASVLKLVLCNSSRTLAVPNAILRQLELHRDRLGHADQQQDPLTSHQAQLLQLKVAKSLQFVFFCLAAMLLRPLCVLALWSPPCSGVILSVLLYRVTNLLVIEERTLNFSIEEVWCK